MAKGVHEAFVYVMNRGWKDGRWNDNIADNSVTRFLVTGYMCEAYKK